MTLNLLFGSSSGSVRVRGRCNAKYGLGRFRAERGTETWIVDCVCGTKDDDGERMLACDNCSIWQHTRCVGIDGLDEIPAKFLCWSCLGGCCVESDCSSGSSSSSSNSSHRNEEVESRILEYETKPIIIPSRKTCRDEIRSEGLGIGSGICMTFDVQ